MESRSVAYAEICSSFDWNFRRTADREYIESILNNRKIKSEKKWPLISRKMAQARARLVPRQHKQKVFELFLELSATYDSDSEVKATQKGINLPESFRGTSLATLIEAHEREHLLQFFSAAPSGNHLMMMFHSLAYQQNAHQMFRLEGDAILAEWEIASIIPTSEKTRMIKLLKSNDVPMGLRETLIGILQNRGFDRAQYLQRQHDIGRYNMEQTQELAESNRKKYLKTLMGIPQGQ